MAARYGQEFVEAVALIAAKAAKDRKVASVDEAVRFAWWSVNTPGDATFDEDFQEHWQQWRVYVHEAGDPEGWEATRSNEPRRGETILAPRPLV